jgi:hypothetical protein
MTIVVPIRPQNNAVFSFAVGLLAARFFLRQVSLVARYMLEDADPTGRVRMTVPKLERLTGYARGILNRSVQELVDSGVLSREFSDGGRPESTFQWSPTKLAELAALVQARQGGGLIADTIDPKPNSNNQFSQKEVWLRAFWVAREHDERYRGAGAFLLSAARRLQQPRPEAWAKLISYGIELSEEFGVPVLDVATITCRRFLKLGGQRREAERHPLPFLPGELGVLEAGVRAELRQRVAPAPRSERAPAMSRPAGNLGAGVSSVLGAIGCAS